MKAILSFLLIFISVFALLAVLGSQAGSLKIGEDVMSEKPEGYPVATFGGGCFWCVESEFRALDGVLFTEVGYMGGDLDDPTYQDITTGKTGHAEVVQVTYDPQQTSFDDLVMFFLTRAHDPTQVNRQGVDVGTQYRSVIFFHDEEQQEISNNIIADLNESGRFSKRIATQVVPAEMFWMGEDYHQQYYEKYEEERGQPHIRVLLKKGGRLLKP